MMPWSGMTHWKGSMGGASACCSTEIITAVMISAKTRWSWNVDLHKNDRDLIYGPLVEYRYSFPACYVRFASHSGIVHPPKNMYAPVAHRVVLPTLEWYLQLWPSFVVRSRSHVVKYSSSLTHTHTHTHTCARSLMCFFLKLLVCKNKLFCTAH